MKETARLTDRKAELAEEGKSALDAKLQLLAERTGGEVTFTYFQPDSRKEGGDHLTITGEVKTTSGFAREVALTDGRWIPMDDILDIRDVK